MDQQGGEDPKGMQGAPADQSVETTPISLRALNVISSHIPHVQAAREQIVGEMEAMLVTGIQELVSILSVLRKHSSSKQNRSLLSSALLTAHNLQVLPETVQNLVGDLIQVVEARVKGAFDMAALGREKGLKGTPVVKRRQSVN